jgi:HD-GYP domain-containing protein (c-di-GMP phosphodiesterase class II)/CheY-like chemotaxis protein
MASAPPPDPWKILVVDDDPMVHAVTGLVLRGFSYAGRGLEILSARSGAEARERLIAEKDLAVVLLDVVMEEEDSGLKTVRFIREELKDPLVRIILRTGQPGRAPVRSVVLDYDINDYKLKSELTADALFVALVAALRAYEDLRVLERNRRGLKRIAESSAALFTERSHAGFFAAAFARAAAVLELGGAEEGGALSAFSAVKRGEGYEVEAGRGAFEGFASRDAAEAIGAAAVKAIERAAAEGRGALFGRGFGAVFRPQAGPERLAYLEAPRALDEWDAQLLELLMANVAIGLDNLELGREIESTQKEIIEVLGEVAEARSRETSHHVKRVAEYSKLLALKLGLAEAEAELLRMAAPMHDVGKLAVPDAVLNKPGKLDEAELALIRTHAQAGHDMLKGSARPIMRLAATIALEHHEKYDGTGYPLGKKGEEISIYGRIVAAADVYDALGCARSYKEAWPLEEIVAYFARERGAYFDPRVADEVIASIREIDEIRRRFPD